MADILRSRLLFFPALALSVVPKCPLCLLAYGGLLGLTSLGGASYLAYLPLAICAALALLVLALFRQSRSGDAAWPFWLALAGAALVIAGRFWLQQSLLVGLGLVLLLGATFAPRRRAAECSCNGGAS